MFCPKCKDEFRPGFTRCASCNVDLVESLSGAGSARSAAAAVPVGAAACSPLALVEYCGFVSLEEARRARDLLLTERISTEIAIRVSGLSPAAEAAEEYWLRVERARYKDVMRLLGYDEAHAAEHEETFACGECGREVAADETFCSGCGARFEDA